MTHSYVTHHLPDDSATNSATNSVLRFVSCVITLTDCVILANRESSQNPYHNQETTQWGWGEEGSKGAYYSASFLAYVVWDTLVSMAITIEIVARHWHIPANYFKKRWQVVQDAQEVTGLQCEGAAAAAEEGEAQEDRRTEDELQRLEDELFRLEVSEIQRLEDEVQTHKKALQIKQLATRPANFSQQLFGKSPKDRAMLAEFEARELDAHVRLGAAQQALAHRRAHARETQRATHVRTLNPRDLRDTLAQKTAKLARTQKTQHGRLASVFSRQNHSKQAQAMRLLEAEIAEIVGDLALLRRLQSCVSAGSPDSADFEEHPSVHGSDDSGFAKSRELAGVMDEYETVSGETAWNVHAAAQRQKEHTTFARFMAFLDVLVAVSSWAHLVLAPLGVPLTLRPLRLFRAVYWVSVGFGLTCLRGLLYGLSVARLYVQATLAVMVVVLISTSTCVYTLYTLRGARFQCVACAPSVSPSFCYDSNYKFNASNSPFPTLMTPVRVCHREWVGGVVAGWGWSSSCPDPFECVDVVEFVESTPFHVDNYLGVGSTLYALAAGDGQVAAMMMALSRSTPALNWLFWPVVMSHVFAMGLFGVMVLRAYVISSIRDMWRRVPLVDMDTSWFRLDGHTPWDSRRVRPTYLPPPVDYGPGLAAGNMSPLPASPTRRGLKKGKDFRNTDTVEIDAFSKVQPRLNLRAVCVMYGESRVCEAITCAVILWHFIVQLAWHAHMTVAFATFLTASEVVVVSVFLLEMAVKVYAAGGLANFASNLWRALEITVVLMSFAGVVQYGAVCCSVLQCVAVCCSVWQCVLHCF